MKIKILSIITRNSKGGSSEFLINLLSQKDEDLENVLIYGGEEKAYNFKSFYVKELTRNINPLKDILAFIRILFLIFKLKPDIIYTHTSKAGILGRFAVIFYKTLSNRKVKIIHSPHGHVFYGYFSRFISSLFILIERVFSYVTDVFVALSENEKVESIGYGLGDYKKWVVIPSGVDYNFKLTRPELKKEIGLDDKDIVVGSVMRFEDVKGDKYFVLAASEILKKTKKGIRFVLVGDGSNFSKIVDMILALGVKDYFIMPGWVNDVYNWINMMDIYVQPSLNEGLGRTVIIAELLKKPIVASSVCGLKDLVVDGYNGFLVAPRDYISLAARINELVFDEDRRILMGKNSFDLVNEEIDGFKKYSFDRSLYLHKKLYFEIIKA